MDIQRLTSADIPAATEVLVSAFTSNAMYQWMLSQPHYENKLRWIMQRRLSLTIQHFGQTFGLNDNENNLASVAIWVPPSKTITNQMLLQAGLLKAPLVLGLKDTKRTLSLISSTGSIHQEIMGNSPHWYLYAVATKPQAQGQGYGKRLIQQQLNEADKHHFPAYLESSSPANLPLYRSLGFHAKKEMIRQPEAPDFWFMCREAVRQYRGL